MTVNFDFDIYEPLRLDVFRRLVNFDPKNEPSPGYVPNVLADGMLLNGQYGIVDWMNDYVLREHDWEDKIGFIASPSHGGWAISGALARAHSNITRNVAGHVMIDKGRNGTAGPFREHAYKVGQEERVLTIPQGICKNKRGIVVDEWSNTYNTFDASMYIIQEDGGTVVAVASVVDFGEGKDAFREKYPQIGIYSLIDMERDLERLRKKFIEQLKRPDLATKGS